MCLSIPAKVVKINGDSATVSVGGTKYEASLILMDGVKEGDYILLHSGYAIGKIDSAKAEENLTLMSEIKRKADDTVH